MPITLISLLSGLPGASAQSSAGLPLETAAYGPASGTDDFLQTLQKQVLPDLIRSITAPKPGRRHLLARPSGEDLRATPYLRAAYQEATQDGIRCKVLQSMGRLQDPSLFSWFLLRLKDPSIRIQCFAIWALGELADRRAIPPLRQKLWNPNRAVHLTAIDALGKMGKDRDLAAVLEIFLSDDEVQVRFITAQALAGVAGPESAVGLIDRLALEPSLDVQEALAKTAGQAGGSVAADHFIDLLKNPLSQAKEHWAEMGLQAGDPSIIVPRIAPLLDGDDFRLKVSAMRILNVLELPMEEDANGDWMNRVKRWAKGPDLVARDAAVRFLKRASALKHPAERTTLP